ncbi:hypothetical protein AB0L57_31600, partial [Nocardia sp. NPDC052254]|uniref:hypothetical protein n=1 Tax=Nocardia sp. NPDC052254 TaxID=3155681 RepID=UPI00344AE84A
DDAGGGLIVNLEHFAQATKEQAAAPERRDQGAVNPRRSEAKAKNPAGAKRRQIITAPTASTCAILRLSGSDGSKGPSPMGLDGSQDDNELLELELIRRMVLARRQQDGVVLAALTLGAELLDHAGDIASRAARILRAHQVDEAEIARDPRAALRADMARDLRRARRIGAACAPGESDPARERRRQQTELLCEVRADLLEVVRRCRRFRFDHIAFTEGIDQGLSAATGKLEDAADRDTYLAWRRGMVLKLSEVPEPGGPPRVFATVDAGPDRGPLQVEWDSCERRLALVARMKRAGLPPLEICDRLLVDLSMSSPLRYSIR